MSQLHIIKIGGNIVDEESSLSAFLQQFASLKGVKVLVHGGGKIATRIGEQLGITSQYVEGRRITDEPTLDLVTMVYGGLLNKKIVAALQSLGCNALGVTGADANLIPADKRPVSTIDFGFVGDVKASAIPVQSWMQLLNSGFIPVVAPLTHDGKGRLLNTNADTLAQEIAKALSSHYQVSLVYSFEKSGVLTDVNDEHSVIDKLDPSKYQQLKKEQKIFAGMIPKLDNAFTALEKGVQKVIIGNALQLDQLINGAAGTTIVHES
jgi:acetylglutamate kinase